MERRVPDGDSMRHAAAVRLRRPSHPGRACAGRHSRRAPLPVGAASLVDRGWHRKSV